MKKMMGFLLFLGIFGLVSTNAFGMTFIDQGANLLGAKWVEGSSGFDQLGFNNPLEGSNWVDIVGESSLFDTTQVKITQQAGSMTFDIYTAFKGFTTLDGTPVEIADFFLTTSKGNYGVDLSWDSKLSSVFSMGVFSLSSGDYITSQDIFRGNYKTLFAGIYDDNGWNNDLSPDWINNPPPPQWHKINVGFKQDGKDSLNNDPLIITTKMDNSDYIYSFTLKASLVKTMGLNGEFDFLFGTAECGNDVIHGTVVPEPSTIVLLGLGLLGFSAVGRKQYMK